MKQLELKHISPYFPFGLKIKSGEDIYEVLSIGKNCVYFKGGLLPYNDFKLILRPLSDLTKEIERNGEKFIPCEQFSYDMECMLRLGDVDTGCQPYSLIQKLIEWHFDIFGLIDKDLAIDINNL